MKEQFDCLVQKMTIKFRRIVMLAFNGHDVSMIHRLLCVYNTYQEEERGGVDYIFDFQNQEDLVTCIQGGLTAEEIANLVAKYNCGNGENYTTKFLFGCNHETPYLLTYSALKNALLGNSHEIVECMLKYPFCYDNTIYCKILTDHIEECDCE